MSATINWPTYSAPGKSNWPRLGKPNVTVKSAETVAGSMAPVSQLSPVGTSTATRTGKEGEAANEGSEGEKRASVLSFVSLLFFISSSTTVKIALSDPPIGRETPVPRRASTITSDSPRRRRSAAKPSSSSAQRAGMSLSAARRKFSSPSMRRFQI